MPQRELRQVDPTGKPYPSAPLVEFILLPAPMGMSHYTIPATLGFTSFPLVSRRLVSIDGVCIVEPEPANDCD